MRKSQVECNFCCFYYLFGAFAEALELFCRNHHGELVFLTHIRIFINPKLGQLEYDKQVSPQFRHWGKSQRLLK